MHVHIYMDIKNAFMILENLSTKTQFVTTNFVINGKMIKFKINNSLFELPKETFDKNYKIIG